MCRRYLAAGVLDTNTRRDELLHLGYQRRQFGVGGGARHHHGDLAEHTTGRPDRQLVKRSAHHFLMHLGQLPADRRRTGTTELLDGIVKARSQPARGFEENTGAPLLGQFGQPGPARRTLARGETLEAELLRRQTGHHQRGGHRGRPG